MSVHLRIFGARPLVRVAAVSMLTVITSLCNTACFAAGDITGKVTRIVVETSATATPSGPPQPTGFVVVNIALGGLTSIPGSPACNVLNAFMIDLANPGGKTAYEHLVIAQALGYDVRVIGRGTCTLWDNQREDFWYADVHYP